VHSFVIANLVGAAAALAWCFGRRPLALIPLLVLAPLPALCYALVAGGSLSRLPDDQIAQTVALVAMACYLSVGAGWAAARLVAGR
jgi:hypothetical protein